MTWLLLDRHVCTILSALTLVLAPKHHESFDGQYGKRSTGPPHRTDQFQISSANLIQTNYEAAPLGWSLLPVLQMPGLCRGVM